MELVSECTEILKKWCNSKTFSKCIELYNHNQNPILEYFQHPSKNPHTHLQSVCLGAYILLLLLGKWTKGVL